MKIKVVDMTYEQALAQPDVYNDQDQYRKLTKAHADLRDVVELFRRHRSLTQELEENKQLLHDSDPDIKAMAQEEIAAARNAGAQVVLVSLCWGKENATKPTNEQKELAQAIADAGADILLGVNPKAVQTVEILTADRSDGRYHPVLCAYSLGSLLTSERQQRTNLAGVLLHATVEYDPATDTVAFDGLTYAYLQLAHQGKRRLPLPGLPQQSGRISGGREQGSAEHHGQVPEDHSGRDGRQRIYGTIIL